MIAIVVVTHGRLGEEMVQTLHGVLGPVGQLEAVSTIENDPEIVKAKIRRTIERIDDGEGTLILTDMLGDTATNLSLNVAGGSRALAGFIREYGRDHIFWASERSRSGAPS